jgi:hypothetical protein
MDFIQPCTPRASARLQRAAVAWSYAHPLVPALRCQGQWILAQSRKAAKEQRWDGARRITPRVRATVPGAKHADQTPYVLGDRGPARRAPAREACR